MAEQPNFNDPYNFSDVYLRNVAVGFWAFLKNKLTWKNHSQEHGTYDVILPVNYALMGDERYVLDAFFDDVPDKRVNMNTDQVPRAVMSITNWEVLNEDFSNPNVWHNVLVLSDSVEADEEEEELIQIASQIKWVPLKLTIQVDVLIDNELDVFKAWQCMMKVFFMYKYFNYTFDRMPLTANFNFIGSNDNPIAREADYGTAKELLKSTYNFEVNTYFPIVDPTSKLFANDVHRWDVGINQFGANPNLPGMNGVQ